MKLILLYEINYLNLLKSIVGKNVLYTAIIWFMGCTIIGIPIILCLVAYKGFSIGYTIASVIYVLGTQKGIVFCILSLLLQNIIIIPSIIALSNSSINLYKVITKDKKRENIKTAILKHTIFSVFIFIILAIASLIETYICNFLLTNYINNI